jgi:hypothetical protein
LSFSWLNLLKNLSLLNSRSDSLTSRDDLFPALGRCLRAASLLMAASVAGMAVATSPAAWSAHDSEVAAHCVQASGLKNARAAGLPMVYDDRLGLTALLVSGHYPQAHMKNRPGRVLCLFDRRKREAFVTYAEQLSITAAPASSRKK